jgi:1-deoxy-D-xylulose-5-phosphate reductoisomerase
MDGWVFEPPDGKRFPALSLAYGAAEVGGTAPATLNAANEVAVGAFLAGRIRFTDIVRVVEKSSAAWRRAGRSVTLKDVLRADAETREEASRIISRLRRPRRP